MKRHPGDPAFKSPIDLVAVKGIGAGTMEAMTPYLTFPAPLPETATRPAGR